ncbi:GTPase HflX [Gallionella capsiferriformans]|jgi:GTP-binding protein HflX|uniref:GTPase HflX n=1 Tax=Gallionella capsiferriformans (strain ES-2) TaxID=395494 RepID=D9SFI1_GALCS|nr:GTPase HflX [Gallionella capsiferriformans]ADL55278.1 GTP-binding proten HflX [Gallionella capsiferriformans ES-2]
MQQTSEGTQAAILVSIDLGGADYRESLAELRLLAETAGVRTLATFEAKRMRPDAALFAGSGKVAEIAEMVELKEVPLVIFNHDLSPAQMRNLTARLGTRVIDRTMLILDIFAQRAQSHEGKVQVELAQLKYMATRLVGLNTDMGQQKFAVGARGPGETQLELDRRKLDKRVHLLKERLEKLKAQRDVMRRSRNRSGVFSVSIVGYTNAGKSTLFNRLTKANVYVANQLFATLDTTSRRMYSEGAGEIVVSDTVGFIRHLPHGLVAAFRSTLEETIQADLLLHVVDASNPNRDDQIAEVNKVLKEIDAGDIPQLMVYNKVDLTEMAAGAERDDCDRIARVFLSAVSGAGMDDLRLALTAAKDAKLVVEQNENQIRQARNLPWD